jgi:hypothetical protein
MPKTFELPEAVTFTIPATGDFKYTVDFFVMSDESLLKGLVRGLKNICGDAVGSKDMTLEDKQKTVFDKVRRFEAGDIGDGVGSVSDHEKEMRTLFAAWLVAKGAKRGDADKVARAAAVESTFRKIVADKGLDTEKAESLLLAWSRQSHAILDARSSIDIEL